MSKFTYGCNEDDFVQNGETMQELTVTITLCEYRNLVLEVESLGFTIDRLRDENKKLTEQNKNLNSFIVMQNPDAVKGLGNVLNSFFKKDKMEDKPTQESKQKQDMEV